MTNAAIVGAYPILQELMQERISASRVAYTIARNARHIEQAFRDFVQEETLLVNSFATKNAAGQVLFENGVPKFEAPQIQAYNEERGQLLQQEVDIDIRRIDLDVFLEAVEGGVKPMWLGLLGFMFKGEEVLDAEGAG